MAWRGPGGSGPGPFRRPGLTRNRPRAADMAVCRRAAALCRQVIQKRELFLYLFIDNEGDRGDKNWPLVRGSSSEDPNKTAVASLAWRLRAPSLSSSSHSAVSSLPKLGASTRSLLLALKKPDHRAAATATETGNSWEAGSPFHQHLATPLHLRSFPESLFISRSLISLP